ncbi:MAG: hypothetical protein ACM33T_07615 [Solirubrobacterales bacterium]
MAAKESRIVGVGSAEFKFERGMPDKERKIGDRKLVAVWTAPLETTDGKIHTATVNEFDDGILYGPSSVPGTFSDFPGAAAAEVTVRWLELANEGLVSKLKRQREVMMAAAVGLAALAIVLVSFR